MPRRFPFLKIYSTLELTYLSSLPFASSLLYALSKLNLQLLTVNPNLHLKLIVYLRTYKPGSSDRVSRSKYSSLAAFSSFQWLLNCFLKENHLVCVVFSVAALDGLQRGCQMRIWIMLFKTSCLASQKYLHLVIMLIMGHKLKTL